MSKRNYKQELVDNKQDRIHDLQNLTNCKFRKPNYAIQAITCPVFANSYKTSNEYEIIGNQEVLATLGDTVLKMIIAEHLLIDKKCNESGKLSIIKSDLEKNESLNKIGDDFEIQNLLFFEGNDLEETKRSATTIEAIIGAIYLSNGIRATKRFVMDKIISFVDVK